MPAAFSRDDFRRLRPSLIAAVCMIAAGIVIAFIPAQLHRDAQEEERAARARRLDSQRQLARIESEASDIRQKLVRYEQLSASGIFEQEQRIEWVERIREIKRARKLYDIQYDIAPQQRVDSAVLPGASVGAGHDFFSSAMQVRMQLLHEGDLLAFLSDLRASAPAHVRVRRCDITRLPGAANAEHGERDERGERGERDDRGVAPQLAAECVIEWITLRKEKGA
ncbi:MAG: hypothetical protein LBE33_02020 [Zoogloeaceae bacterium]|jgi:hypothetical protein|nr:hypothetical protein [Zoogloeaceae bacterium]